MTGPPLTLEATPAGRSDTLWRRLLSEGRAAYRIEARGAARRRSRLQSAKLFEARGRVLCEAIILDQSETGFRLLLSHDCRLPDRFGLHVDLTRATLTVAVAWRRERSLGAQVLSPTPPVPLRPSDRAALAGRYYAVPN